MYDSKGKRELFEKDGIRVYYTDYEVSFEEIATARGIIFTNDGFIKLNNFNTIETEYFKGYFSKIYEKVKGIRDLERRGLV